MANIDLILTSSWFDRRLWRLQSQSLWAHAMNHWLRLHLYRVWRWFLGVACSLATQTSHTSSVHVSSCDTNPHPRSDWCLETSLHPGWSSTTQQIRRMWNVLLLPVLACSRDAAVPVTPPELFGAPPRIPESQWGVFPHRKFLYRTNILQGLVATKYAMSILYVIGLAVFAHNFGNMSVQVCVDGVKWRCEVRQNRGPWWGRSFFYDLHRLKKTVHFL